MSLEFQLAWRCPHYTVEEVVVLDADRRSLFLRQPVAASGQVRLMVNDDTGLFIPQAGLYSAAILTSSVSGPYDILPNEDVFTVAASGGSETLSFGAKTSTIRLTTDQVLQRIQRAKWQHVEARNENGYLILVDVAGVGPNAFVKVSGTAAGALGFGQPGLAAHQYVAYGRQIYPAWDLYLRPDTITNRYPRFRERLRNNPMIKATYAVPVQRCRRCGATFVENDFRYNAQGNMILIQNEDLLYQAALKILLTDRGSNPFFPNYGTTIRERIGTKALSGVASVLSEDVRRSLAQVQAYQTQQARYQQVTFKERLYSVLSVDVKRHAQDPSTFMIEVTVQNASGKPIELNIVFTVPEVVALMGSNGLMLGTEAAGLGTGEARRIFAGDRNTLTGGQ